MAGIVSLSASDTNWLGYIAAAAQGGPSAKVDVQEAIGHLESAEAKRLAEAIAVEKGVWSARTSISRAMRTAARGILAWATGTSAETPSPTSSRTMRARARE